MRQIPLSIGIESPRTFETFVPGANALAIAHLQALGAQAAPVYLWGGSGAGKTHLLEALVHRFDEQGMRAGWFSAGDAAPWAFEDAWSLIVIDNADALDAEQQHAAFSVFVEATTRGVPLVAAGRVPPVDLAVREDLRTRFGWGPVFALQALDEAGTRSVLLREAGHMGLKLTPDVMDYLLTRFARDLTSLLSLLQQLNSFSIAELRPVTVPLLKKMIAEEGLAA